MDDMNKYVDSYFIMPDITEKLPFQKGQQVSVRDRDGIHTVLEIAERDVGMIPGTDIRIMYLVETDNNGYKHGTWKEAKDLRAIPSS